MFLHDRSQWRIQEGSARDARPLLVQILSFSCSFQQKFCKIIGWCTPSGVSIPALGNPGSATGSYPYDQFTRELLHGDTVDLLSQQSLELWVHWNLGIHSQVPLLQYAFQPHCFSSLQACPTTSTKTEKRVLVKQENIQQGTTGK